MPYHKNKKHEYPMPEKRTGKTAMNIRMSNEVLAEVNAFCNEHKMDRTTVIERSICMAIEATKKKEASK